MQVICCDLRSLNVEGTFTLRIDQLEDEAYDELAFTQTNAECAYRLFQIARNEDRTLHLIMAIRTLS